MIQPYVVTEIPEFLTPAECDAIRETARTRLKQSRVYAAQSDNVDTSVRVSDQCWLYDKEKHPVVDALNRKVEALTRIAPDRYEALQVVRYRPGGFYRPHYDACIEAPEKCTRMNHPFRAQRYITVLVYLNDDFTGGETHFPKVPFTTRPRKGLAVLFYNCDADGVHLEDALHGGNPVQTGEKWICNKWIHYPTPQPRFDRTLVEGFWGFFSSRPEVVQVVQVVVGVLVVVLIVGVLWRLRKRRAVQPLGSLQYRR